MTVAKSKVELCRILDISRPTLDAWLKLEDRPETRSNGEYPVEEWQAFKLNRKEEQDSIPVAMMKAKLIIAQEQATQAQIKTLKDAGELVPLEWAKQIFAHIALSMRSIIQEADISEEDKAIITDKLAKIDCENYISQLRIQTAGDVGEEPATGGEDGADEGMSAS